MVYFFRMLFSKFNVRKTFVSLTNLERDLKEKVVTLITCLCCKISNYSLS